MFSYNLYEIVILDLKLFTVIDGESNLLIIFCFLENIFPEFTSCTKYMLSQHSFFLHKYHYHSVTSPSDDHLTRNKFLLC